MYSQPHGERTAIRQAQQKILFQNTRAMERATVRETGDRQSTSQAHSLSQKLEGDILNPA